MLFFLMQKIFHSYYLNIIVKNDNIHFLYPMNGNYNELYYQVKKLNDDNNKYFNKIIKENISISQNGQNIKVEIPKFSESIILKKQKKISLDLEELLIEINNREYSNIKLKLYQYPW